MGRFSVVKRVLLVTLCGVFLIAGIVVALAEEKKSAANEKKKVDHRKAFAIYKKKCLQCHDSVADPEKRGHTRDEWLLVLKTMHGYGLGLSPQEVELISGLLYDLRRGMEKDPG
ncbi:MAG: cytochrome c [Desulfomonile tiedjei]|nr:cytochrome c [Desulfomonile tiedjei]